MSPERERLPFIYCRRRRRPLSFYPPAQTGRLLFCSPVYMNFQLPGCTALVSPSGWWALAPPSHPYLRWPDGWRGGYFLLHRQALANLFPLGSGMPCVARTFLSLSFLAEESQRQTGSLLFAPAKVRRIIHKFVFAVHYFLPQACVRSPVTIFLRRVARKKLHVASAETVRQGM